MTKHRRGHGEGSIYRRRDGQWTGALSIGRPGGPRERTYLYGRTQREVQDRLIKVRADRQAGLPVISVRTTCADFFERWLETMEGSVRPATYRRYAEYARLHVVPALGGMRLSQLTPEDLQRLYTSKRKVLAQNTIHHLHRVVHEALNQAVRWEYVSRNVADLVKAPKVERTEMTVWTKDEARAFLRAAEADRLGVLYLLALATGMRQGEMLGLRWSAVDLDNGRISIQKTLQRTKHGYELLEPKTAHSRRSLEIDPQVVHALKRHRRTQLQERLQAGPKWSTDCDFVFSTPVGLPIDGTHVTHFFRRLAARLGFRPIRFHDLRHTCATILLQDGVHPKVVQEMLGHSTIAITLDTYSHVVAGMHLEASRIMGRALFG